jgi:hypothetical protein
VKSLVLKVWGFACGYWPHSGKYSVTRSSLRPRFTQGCIASKEEEEKEELLEHELVLLGQHYFGIFAK